MRINANVIDQYSYLDFKQSMHSHHTPSMMVPGWISPIHHRRLVSYMMLYAYVHNTGRNWMNTDIDEEAVSSRREYGDAATIVDSVFSSIIGATQKLWVQGAIGEEVLDQQAMDQLDLLEEWAQKESFLMKMIECERDTVTLGDGVYVLGWDEDRHRPRLRVYDPGFYFPAYEGDGDEEFPETVHIAYEFERTIDNKIVTFLRRISWRLIHDAPERQYPWDPAGTTSTTTVLMSDGEWRLDQIKNELLDLADQAGDFRVHELDLMIDFIPVIHMTNNIAGKEHYGTSSLSRVMQMLDDLASTDTDLQAASATTGTPPIAIGGVGLGMGDNNQLETYGPGTLLRTGDGSATLIDTSSSLDALIKYDEHLLSRLSVNSRIPESLLGRVKPNEVPSGIALTLSFTPHINLIHEMRLVRDQKYALLLKFASRFFQLDGQLTEIRPAKLVFGSFLPADRQEASLLVTQLLRADKPIISLETAVDMLVQAGFPIEDSAQEVFRVQTEDFNTANELLIATGDTKEVRDRLALAPDPSGDIVPPSMVAPPAPVAPGSQDPRKPPNTAPKPPGPSEPAKAG